MDVAAAFAAAFAAAVAAAMTSAAGEWCKLRRGTKGVELRLLDVDDDDIDRHDESCTLIR